MSNEAQAGESRTTSPPPARERAAAPAPRLLHGARVEGGDGGGLENGADLGAVRPDQHGLAHAAAGGLPERAEVLPLALAARDQDDGLRKALERLDGRRDVGALGVVVVGDRALVEDALDAVGDTPERADAAADGLGRQPGPQGAGGGRQHVLDVVLAAQQDLAERADLLDAAVKLGDDPPVADEDAVVERCEPA